MTDMTNNSMASVATMGVCLVQVLSLMTMSQDPTHVTWTLDTCAYPTAGFHLTCAYPQGGLARAENSCIRLHLPI